MPKITHQPFPLAQEEYSPQQINSLIRILNQIMTQLDTDSFRLGTKRTPASAGDTGTAGTILYDDNYIYVCTDTDTWKRAALSTWQEFK